MTTTHAAVSDALDRLGDLDNDIWSREEMELYLQDRYDEFCRRSKALFDIVVIENLPPIGNWQTDLERYLALQMPGLAVSDGPFHMTDDSERNLSGGPSDVGGTYRGPAGITNPNQRQYADDDEIDSVPTTVLGGYLPQSTVEVLRVAYDNRDLLGLGSQQMRRIDPQYENREGDPQFFTYDKDGLFFLRVVPAASGDATYPTTNGGLGTLTWEYDSLTDATIVYTNRPNNLDTLAFNGVTYKFVNTPFGGLSANIVEVARDGSSDDTTYENFVKAVNQSGTDGVEYQNGTGTVTQPFVTASINTTTNTVTLTSTAGLTITGTPLFATVTQQEVEGPTVVTQEITGSGTGGYGILRYRSGDDDSAMFPSGGPWGSPTRIHPTEGNIKVEVTRLGRSLATHGIELPPAYTKYVIFGAMARALRRDGPGQDIALADHYDQRFEQGLERITGKLNKMSPERVGRFRQPGRPDEFGLGLPIMPSAYENPWR